MTPTTCTGCRMDPATLKYTADPPSASAVSPNGVKIESSAMLPTTSRLMELHPVGGGDAKEPQRVGKDDLRGPREEEPRLFGGGTFGSAYRTGMVIPPMYDRRELVQVGDDPVRLALPSRAFGQL